MIALRLMNLSAKVYLAFTFALLSQVGSASGVEPTVGIGGHGRVGFWAECRLDEVPADATHLIVETRDGDGVAVEYRASIKRDQPARCYFQLGPDQTPLKICVAGDDGKCLEQTVIESPVPIPFTQNWVLAIGDSLGIEAASDQQGRRNFPVVSVVDDGSTLPDQWMAYEGLDLMIVAGSQLQIMNDLRESQKQAIGDWVRLGGRIVLSLGGRSTVGLEEADWLTDLLGVEIGSEVIEVSPNQFETATKTQTRLRPFNAIRLPIEGGTNLLNGTFSSNTVPLVKEYLIGFGRLMIVAADLDYDPFVSWPDRQTLLERFVPGVLGAMSTGGQRRRKSDVGYNDMVGQLRKTLDHFGSRQRIPFKWIAAFLMLYLLIIGPVDYFVVNRWLGKPLLGWVTFPIATLSFALLAFFGTTQSIPDKPAVNQFTVLDVAPSQGVGRAFVWSQFMSSESKRVDFQYDFSGTLIQQQQSSPLIGWYGAAGAEFGGLSTAAQESAKPYRIEESDSASDGALGGAIHEMPFATAATKGLALRMQFKTDIATEQGIHKRAGRTDLLRGSLTNPLPYTLLDSVLVYRGLLYQLPTHLGPGKRVADVGRAKFKNLKIRLTRRTIGKGTSSSEDWDVLMDDDLDRVMEVMMLHRAAGGASYTVLNNRVADDIDLSYILDTEHALLIGRIDEPVIQLGGPSMDDAEIGTNRCYVRVVLPIESKK